MYTTPMWWGPRVKPSATHLWWTARCWRKTAQRWSPSSSSPTHCWGRTPHNYWLPGLSLETFPAALQTDTGSPGGIAFWPRAAPAAGGPRTATRPRRTPPRRRSDTGYTPALEIKNTMSTYESGPGAHTNCYSDIEASRVLSAAQKTPGAMTRV